MRVFVVLGYRCVIDALLRRYLDAVVAQRPVVLVRADGHALVANTAAMDIRPGAMGRLVDALEVRLAREGCDAARFIAARHAACGVPPRRAEEARAPSARPAP